MNVQSEASMRALRAFVAIIADEGGVQLVLVGDVHLADQAQDHPVGRNADNLGPKARVSWVRVFHVEDPRETADEDVRLSRRGQYQPRAQPTDPLRPSNGPSQNHHN